MAQLILHPEKIQDIEAFIKLCPFGAIEASDSTLQINASCRMCRICVKKGPEGAAEFVESTAPTIDKAAWQGIAVYVEHNSLEGLHPVSLELIGKARELAKKTNQKVYALLPGWNVSEISRELLHYGVDEIHVYDQPELLHFLIEPYTAVFSDFTNQVHPSTILIGATTLGRQLAPRVAAHLRTGLTADCTQLEMLENTDLIQIRPAFGGNIMAQIHTPAHRPQMATVRYKVMDMPARACDTYGKCISHVLAASQLKSSIQVLEVLPKPQEQSVEGADILIAAGRGIKKESDLALLKELADLLNGQLACTRPLAECGWVEARRQVGLSGRTVRPKLIITCGISGAIQFVAGMNHADTIIAINKDQNAPIFRVAHYGLVGDLYEIVPKLITMLKG